MEVDESLIIGDYPCEFNVVLKLMQTSQSFSLLDSKWPDFSRALNIRGEEIKRLRRNFLLGTLTLNDVVDDVLQNWRAEAGDKATLKALYKALDDCALSGIEEVLQNNFGRSITTQGEEDSSIPSLPKYYIPRTLSGRTKLNPEIFKAAATDAFIFSGMKRHQLSLLAKGEFTDISGNQRKKVTVRFILLELEEDVRDIFKVSSCPVHWIEKRSDSYYWKSSSGSLNLIHRFIAQDEEIKYAEADFVDKIFNEFNSTSISIADTPGMGKSLLLSSIAHQTKVKFPERHVLFLTLRDVLEDVLEEHKASSEHISKWVHTKISCRHGDTCTSNIELYLDGYDEVLASQLDQANQLFKVFKEMSNLRFTVTTRPHLQNELELTLGVLSYSILPFDLVNQIQFLCDFWITNHEAEDCDTLTHFSYELLSKLDDKKIKRERLRDIAGVPLLCTMLALVYADDALRCCKLGESMSVKIHITSIFSVFDKLMEKALHNNPRLANSISKRLKQKIVENHVYEAFKVVFPDCVSVCPGKHQKVSPVQMYAVGLLEFNVLTQMPQFVHRTFAEFLVAEFLVSNMSNSKACADLLMTDGIGTTQESKNDWNTFIEVQHYPFKNPVISYFINGQLEKKGQCVNYSKLKKIFRKRKLNVNQLCVSTEKIRQSLGFAQVQEIVEEPNRLLLLTASAADNLADCFDLILIMKPVTKLRDQDISNLLITAALRRSSEDILRKILQFVITLEYRKTKLSNLLYAPLRVAAEKGNYACAVAFLNLLTSQNQNIKGHNLLYNCLYLSMGDQDEMIEEKIEIVKFVCSIDKEALEERDRFLRTPLLAIGAHPKLSICLLELGANPNVVSNYNETVLHLQSVMPKIWKGLVPQMYSELYDCLLAHGFALFNQKSRNGETPLHVAVRKLELDDRVLDSFQSNGADFNANGDDGYSVLLAAIYGRRSARFIDRLIKHHGCTTENHHWGISVLHYAAGNGTLETIRYLVESGKFDIDDKDMCENTPLYYALQRHICWNDEDLDIAEFLVDAGADLELVDSKLLFQSLDFLDVNTLLSIQIQGILAKIKDTESEENASKPLQETLIN